MRWQGHSLCADIFLSIATPSILQYREKAQIRLPAEPCYGHHHQPTVG
jgi:hypothetical protein